MHAQRILNKSSLKGKHTPTVLICSVSVFHCHALLSHRLFSLPRLICCYSTHPSPPSSLPLFSLSLNIPDALISISHAVIFISLSLFFFKNLFSSYFGEAFVCLWLCCSIAANHQKDMTHASTMLLRLHCVIRL